MSTQYVAAKINTCAVECIIGCCGEDGKMHIGEWDVEADDVDREEVLSFNINNFIKSCQKPEFECVNTCIKARGCYKKG